MPIVSNTSPVLNLAIILESVCSAAEALRHRAGFFIADFLLAQVLAEAGETQ